jgi:hypothetical protein
VQFLENNIARLRIKDRVVAQPLQIANHLAKHFSKVSETSQYTPQFQRRKTEAETTAMYVNMEDTSLLNSTFSMKEMQEAQKTRVWSSLGLELIPDQQ